MASSSKFDTAGARLDKALKALEGAVVKGKQASETQKTQESQADEKLQTMEAQIAELIVNRDQLTEELDVERARANKLGEIKGQVSERIDAVMDNIRLLLSNV